jgi:hypothetical protein
MSPEYLAGIVDGEGCIGVTHGRGFSVRLTIKMKNARFIRSVAKEWNGSFYAACSLDGCSVVCWSGQRAEDLIKVLLPFLIVKRRVAELALLFRDEQRKCRELCPHGTAYPLAMKQRLALLKDTVQTAVHQEYN